MQLVSFLTTTVIEPLWSFFRKNGVQIGVMILAFIFLFGIGEAFMGKMSIVFYKGSVFESDIAIYSKGLGWITTVIFTLIGGLFALRTGVVRALLISGIAMAAINILFSVLHWVGQNIPCSPLRLLPMIWLQPLPPWPSSRSSRFWWTATIQRRNMRFLPPSARWGAHFWPRGRRWWLNGDWGISSSSRR